MILPQLVIQVLNHVKKKILTSRLIPWHAVRSKVHIQLISFSFLFQVERTTTKKAYMSNMLDII